MRSRDTSGDDNNLGFSPRNDQKSELFISNQLTNQAVSGGEKLFSKLL